MFEKKTKEWGAGKWVRVGMGAFASLVLLVMAILILAGVDVAAVLVAIPTILIALFLFTEAVATKLYFGRREVLHWKNLLHMIALLFSPVLIYIGVTMLPSFAMTGLSAGVRSLNGWLIVAGAVVGVIEAFVE